MKTKIIRTTQAYARPSSVPRSVKAKLIRPLEPKHVKLSGEPKIGNIPFETYERSADGIPHAIPPPLGRLRRIRRIVSKGKATAVKKYTNRLVSKKQGNSR
jgi:hypothetical protein